MLQESIKKYIDSLKQEVNDNNESLELIKELEEFATSIKNSPDSLVDYDVEKYISIFLNEKEKANTYSKNLNALKTYIEFMKQNNSELFELTPKQIDFINSICSEIESFVEISKVNLDKNKSLNYIITKFNSISQKVNSNTALSSDDVDTITSIIKDYDLKDQIIMLKEIIHHNLEAEKRQVNKNEIIDEEVLLDTNSETAEQFDIEDVIRILSVDKKDKESVDKIKACENEILSMTNLKNIKDVVTYLQDRKIYQNFKDINTIIAIITNGNLYTVTEAFNEFTENGLISNNIIYDYASFWTEQHKIPLKERSKPGRKKGSPTPEKTKILNNANYMYRTELYEKIGYLKSYGIDPFADEKSSVSVLNQSLNKIQNRVDQLFECELINPYFQKEATYNDVVQKHSVINHSSSFLANFKERHVYLLQGEIEKNINKPLEIYETNIDKFFSERDFKKGYFPLSSNFQNLRNGFNINHNNLVITNEELMPDYAKMDKIVKDYHSVQIKDETLLDPFIMDLDENYMVPEDQNHYKYIIDGRTISRNKVLRLYEALKEYNENNPEKLLNYDDIKLFCVTYKTFFDKDRYEEIKKDINSLGRGSSRL